MSNFLEDLSFHPIGNAVLSQGEDEIHILKHYFQSMYEEKSRRRKVDARRGFGLILGSIN